MQCNETAIAAVRAPQAVATLSAGIISDSSLAAAGFNSLT